MQTAIHKALLIALIWYLSIGVSHAATPAEATYRVRVPDGPRASNLGSGTAIHPQMIVTCSHVVGHRLARGVTVTHPWTGATCQAETVAFDPASDLALLWIADAERLATVELAEADPRPGDAVSAAGYGHAGVLRAATGRVLALGSAAHASIRVESGDSGCGLFNSRGQLCGVVHACDGSVQTRDFVEGTSFATPTSALRRLVAQWETQCGPNGCPILPRGGRSAAPSEGRMKPINPPPHEKNPPAQPAPQVAPQPAPPALQPPQLDPALLGRLAEASAKLDKLAADVEALKNKAAAAGPPGPPGPKGDPGDASEWRERLAAAPLTVQILDEHGAVKQESKAYLGGAPLRLQFVPIKR